MNLYWLPRPRGTQNPISSVLRLPLRYVSEGPLRAGGLCIVCWPEVQWYGLQSFCSYGGLGLVGLGYGTLFLADTEESGQWGFAVLSIWLKTSVSACFFALIFRWSGADAGLKSSSGCYLSVTLCLLSVLSSPDVSAVCCIFSTLSPCLLP